MSKKKFLDDSGVNLIISTIKELISTAVSSKVDKASGKGLSTNDYTTAEKTKLSGISDSADAVSFSRSLTSGTKVGTITINGSDTELYAPTNTDTHYASKNVVGSKIATTNTSTALTNGNVYLNSVENGGVTSSHKISGSGATAVKTDAEGNILIESTNTTYSAAGTELGLVKSGGDVTISSGIITVNDDSHDHVISNVDGLQSALDEKASFSHTHTVDAALSSTSTNPVQNKVVKSALDEKVPTNRTINGKSLSGNITLSASDVGADTSGSASTALTNAKTYTDTKINQIVGEGASETLNTIGEISAAIEDNQEAIDLLNAAIGNKANNTTVDSHVGNKSNPHSVTKAQVGLENVDNTSDANKPVSTAMQTALNNKTNISVLPNDSGEIKTKYRISNKNYTNGNTWYFKLCDLPVNNDGNYASTIVSGRIGGWTSGNMSYINALVWNRDTPGIALSNIAGSASDMKNIWGIADLVLYTNGTSATAKNTATLYVKCTGYYVFDLDLELYQGTGSITYNGTYITSTPSGVLAAQASTSTKRMEIVNGKAIVNGQELSFASHTHDSRYYTESEIDSKVSTLQSSIDGKAALSHGTHVTYSTANPVVAGTATPGTATTVSRSDHVHPAQTSVSGSSGSCTGNSATATKLATARAIQTNLGSTSSVSFDGSKDIAPGVTGILPLANGGTGSSTAAGVLEKLGLTATAAELNYCDGVTSNIQTQIDSLNTKLSHIGMIIHTTTLDTMEKVIAIYGGVKWIKIEGRFLLGQSSSYTVNATGGESSHTLTTSEMPGHSHTVNGHTHSIPALSGTANSAGSHTHSVSGTAATVGLDGGAWNFATQNESGLSYNGVFSSYPAAGGVARYGGGSTVSSSNGDTLYINVSHSHSVSGTANSAGSHTHSVSTNSSTTGSSSPGTSSSGSGNAHNNMPPYKVVYIWERTA